MSYENTGALFKNNEKSKEKQPDFTGDITVNNVKYRLAGWKRVSSKGANFISLVATELKPEVKKEEKTDFIDDDIGF